MKQFVPAGQSAIWYARYHGFTVTLAGDDVTLTTAAPAEACATNNGDVASWGPIMTGTSNADECSTHAEAPMTPRVNTAKCQRNGGTVVMSGIAAEGDEGPCMAGEASVVTWIKQ